MFDVFAHEVTCKYDILIVLNADANALLQHN